MLACELPLEPCDRGCDRHAQHVVELRPGVTRIVCSKCMTSSECASCGKALPRWQTTYTDNHEGGGDRFCPECCGVRPGEVW
jgi:membrane protease subunit (stomatin/prohibitin family)